MIDFACKEFELDDVLKCALNLTKSELDIMNYFLRDTDRWVTTENIATELKLDLSTVQKAVKKLHSNEVLKRSQNNLDNGGYVYIYRIYSRREIKNLIMDIVYTWVNRVDNELDQWIMGEQDKQYSKSEKAPI
ncbi:transcriptional regulator, TrmB [Methanohalobium evestigatum Z-7303]|uniref:Transcriptional regulator, TrmB n=1 Tax=Methanohalobium evestigatum (strain ATCC BAA-1072 / DSM 3721 / NBRC 107634 / OCM 161 / Z-7303) TaxID=644295 RepID=D7E7D2_METEZ|nr:TrmB family transcriptional regulator [Methanohalobium evestigatum]ADI73881.1 transcriptional regulator, TrmB [Methanohalobium evestigatum Z-7303]